MEKKGYKHILKQKSFVAYVFANVINRFGDSLDSIAFTWIIYTITGNAFWSALIFGVNRLPTILLQPFLGVLVDKMNKKKVLISTDIIRGICVFFIGLGLIQGWLNEWHLLFTTIFISTAEAFRMPASASMLPHLLNEEDYEYGVSLNQGLLGTVELIGLASAGFIIGWLGVESAVFIDMVTFFLCAVVLLFVRLKPVLRIEESNQDSYFQELKNGFRFVKNNKLIWYILMLAVFMNGIFTPFNALQAPLISEILKSGEAMLSIVGMSITIGGIFGSFVYPKVKDHLSEFLLIKVGAISLILMYVAPLMIGQFIQGELLKYSAVLITGIVCGILIALLNTYVGVLTVQIVKPEYLGRINSILYAISAAAMPFVSFIVSGVVVYIGTKNVFIGCVALAILFYFTVCSKKVYNSMVVNGRKKIEVINEEIMHVQEG